MLHGLVSFFDGSRPQRVGRGMRRLMICVFLASPIIFYATAVLDLRIGGESSRFFGWASFIAVLTSAGLAVFWFRYLRKVDFAANSATTLEERAQMDFGRSFKKLSEPHRFDVRVRVRREIQKGPAPPDEREDGLQREADRKALRVLRAGLPGFALAYWGVCLCLPGGPVRAGLLMGAVAISAAVLPVLILPDLIRMWTEPDPAGEPAVVVTERRA